MTYELAKQLKDAGFPYKSPPEFYEFNNYVKQDGGKLYIPTLSELIEACGDRFYELSNLGNEVWQAKDLKQKDGLWQMYRGSTPEEAVANLWLKLNTK